jgi:hypothetical protein
MPFHEAHIQMAFCPRIPKEGVPKLPKLGLLQLWVPITSCANLGLRWGLKQTCSPHQELSNGMSHATYMQVNRVNSWLLVVGSQTTNLTPGLSFGHNLCFKCPNGSCEPILNIYVSISFQWYKEFFNPLGFDPCNPSLNIRLFPHLLLHSWEHAAWLSGFLLGPQLCNPLPWSRTQG